MTDQPLDKPAHLRPVADTSWRGSRPWGAIALAVGIVAFLVVAVVHGQLSSTPDWRVSVPGFVATVIAAGISVARREPKAYWLWALGLGLATASLVLGWFLMLAIVVGATVIAILILHAIL